MITRRCTQRQFLLRPDADTNNAFVYCLVEAAQRFRIQLLFAAVMSNHHHTGIYDEEGNYPAFLEHFHKMLAKCMNAIRGRRENFWSSEHTHVVRLESPEHAAAAMAYALANPAAADLVEESQHWPGVNTYNTMLSGGVLTARRPDQFFRKDGSMPSEVRLTLGRIPGCESMSTQAYVEYVSQLVRKNEERAAEDRRARGARVLGKARVLQQKWTDTPPSEEKRRSLEPTTPEDDVRRRAAEQRRDFLDAYRAAWEEFKRGVRTALFPVGTWRLRAFILPAALKPS